MARSVCLSFHLFTTSQHNVLHCCPVVPIHSKSSTKFSCPQQNIRPASTMRILRLLSYSPWSPASSSSSSSTSSVIFSMVATLGIIIIISSSTHYHHITNDKNKGERNPEIWIPGLCFDFVNTHYSTDKNIF